MTRIEQAYDRLHAAEKNLAAVVAKECPVGKYVQWIHGQSWRRGTVLGSVDRRVHIKTDSGKICWIHAYRLEMYR